MGFGFGCFFEATTVHHQTKEPKCEYADYLGRCVVTRNKCLHRFTLALARVKQPHPFAEHHAQLQVRLDACRCSVLRIAPACCSSLSESCLGP